MNEKFVHIDVFVDITDPEQISALSTFLTKVGKNAQTPEAPAPQPEPEPTPEPEPEPEPEKPAAEEKTYQVEEVREKLKEKVSEHREEIKAKLTELGAPNVSSLDPSKYTEFVNFLEGLE